MEENEKAQQDQEADTQTSDLLAPEPSTEGFDGERLFEEEVSIYPDEEKNLENQLSKEVNTIWTEDIDQEISSKETSVPQTQKTLPGGVPSP